MKTKRTFVGLHVHKCAGMSLLEMAQEGLPPDELYQSTAHINNWLYGRPGFLDIHNHRRLRFVWGHSTHEQMLFSLHRPLLFTGLREPRARLISHANYVERIAATQGLNNVDADSWIRRQDNPVTWFLIHRFPTLAGHPGPGSPVDKAKRVLNAFQYVYFTETFNEGSSAILNALGVDVALKKTNAREGGKTDFDIDPRQLQWDEEIYEWAWEKFSKKKLDIEEPMTGILWKFLGGSANAKMLEDHLFQEQANQFSGWGKLPDIAASLHEKSARLEREAKFYEKFLAGQNGNPTHD